MPDRGRFAGGDVSYLREVQYRDSSKLAARANMHAKYGRGDWFEWLGRQVTWSARAEVLEVGCGAGWLWSQVAADLPEGPQLTLTDHSIGMVREAVPRAVDTSHFASVRGGTMDAQRLPFRSTTFDVAVANHVFHHLPHPALGVAELSRVLRDQGMALLAVNGRSHLRELFEIRREVFEASGTNDETIEVFGIESGEPLLRERFGSVELRRYPDVLRATDPDDVLAYMTSAPPEEDATEQQRAHLREAIVDRFVHGVLEITKDVGVFVCREPLR